MFAFPENAGPRVFGYHRKAHGSLVGMQLPPAQNWTQCRKLRVRAPASCCETPAVRESRKRSSTSRRQIRQRGLIRPTAGRSRAIPKTAMEFTQGCKTRLLWNERRLTIATSFASLGWIGFREHPRIPHYQRTFSRLETQTHRTASAVGQGPQIRLWYSGHTFQQLRAGVSTQRRECAFGRREP